MVKEVAGNLFESGADTLVNPVNCVGVMGKGWLWNLRSDSRQCLRITPNGVPVTRCGLVSRIFSEIGRER